MTRLSHHLRYLLPTLLIAVLVVPQVAYGFINGLLWTIVSGFLGTLMAVGAGILNAGINLFVIGFGDLYLTTGLGQAVDSVWVVIRDVMNLAFIFGLIYVGFKIILNTDDSRSRTLLARLIIAALLVNFSLFIVKFVVDMSNVLAANIMLNGFPDAPLVVDGDELYDSIDTVDVGGQFMNVLEVGSLQGGEEPSIGFILGAAIFYIIAAFVFAAGGIVLTIRFAILNLFIALSPLMFIGWALPPLERYTSQYWEALLKRAFFAPIYLLFLYFTLTILINMSASLDFADRTNNLASTFGGEAQNAFTSSVTTVPFFVLSCIFLIASIVIASKFGAEGASTAVSLGRRGAQRFGRSTARFTGRQTIGRGARYAGAAAEKANRRVLTPLNTRLAQQGRLGQKVARGIDSSVGAGLRGAQGASFAGSESYKDRQKRVGEQNARLNRERQEGDRRGTISDELANYNRAVASGNFEARRDAANSMGGQVRRMSNDEMVEYVRRNRNMLNEDAFVQNLTDGQMDALRDSGLMNNAENSALGNRRNEAIITEAQTAFDDAGASAQDLNNSFNQLSQTLGNMTAERKAGLGVSDPRNGPPSATNLDNANVAVHLSDKDIEEMEKTGRLSAAQAQQVRAARSAGQAAIADGSLGAPAAAPAEQSRFFADRRRELVRNPQQAANLSADVFTEPDMAEHLTPESVAARLRNGDITGAQIDAIRTNIDNYILGAPSITEQRRRTAVWQAAATRGGNSSWISSLGLTAI